LGKRGRGELPGSYPICLSVTTNFVLVGNIGIGHVMLMRQNIIEVLLGILGASLLAPTVAFADSWAPPTERTDLSADGTVRFTVTPRAIDDILDYFQDQIDRRPLNGSEPHGLLARSGSDGDWTTIWEANLVNDVAPTSALVTNSADYVVTFDNWHSVGYGDDVVVIYNSMGEVVRSFGLTDFLSEDHLLSIPRSASSIWWGGDHHFSADETRLVLKIIAPGTGMRAENGEYLDIDVNLSDGSIVTPRTSEWRGVEQLAQQISEEREVAERDRQESFVRPLLAPIDGIVTDWHHYLNEAFDRVDPDWPYGSASTTVFFAPGHDRHELSIGWARERLQEEHFEGDSHMFASPSQTGLTEALISLAREVTLNGLDGVRLYVAVDSQHNGDIETAFEHTGAIYIPLDPFVPIDQRPERMTAEGRASAFARVTEEMMRDLEILADDIPQVE